MFTQPSGPILSPEQAGQLDDSYFQSRPLGYFSSRITSILSTMRQTRQAPTEQETVDFASELGLEGSPNILNFTNGDRTLQIATDAFAVRHHAAETLVRLYHGLTIGAPQQGAARSVWAAIAEGPNLTKTLVDQARAHLVSDEGHDRFWQLVLTNQHATNGHGQETEITQALNVVADWLHHAMDLLVRNDVNINAAHNKVKHGLSVRARNDRRLTFTTKAPHADGTVPLSSIIGDKAVDIFDGVTMDYLARAPKQDGIKQGLEISTLNLKPTKMLAETWMMAVAHAAMFHVAAAEHFPNGDIPIADFPPLPLSPTPRGLLGEAVVGMRHPITTPPDGSPLSRTTGVAFRTQFVPFELRGTWSPGVVVDD